VFDIVVGILSIILGAVAIAVSWKLYQMSEAGATRMREAESAIANHVRELDRIFNLLYSDTWSLVRESYTSMQRQMWGPASAREGGEAQPIVMKKSEINDTSDAGDAEITPDSELTTVQHEDEQLELVLLAAYEKLSKGGVRIRAQDLVAFAERLGYPSIDALNSLHDLIFVKKRLFLASNRFTPQAVLAKSTEEASRIQETLASETIEQMVRGLPPAPPAV
jgi:hypothetical protein